MSTLKLLLILGVICTASALTAANVEATTHCVITSSLTFLAALFVQDWDEARPTTSR